LIARGYAFTGESSRIKRADYILTRYTFKGLDRVLTILISLSFIVVLVLRYGFGYLDLNSSWFITWFKSIIIG